MKTTLSLIFGISSFAGVAVANTPMVKLIWPKTQGPYLISVSNENNGEWHPQYWIGDGNSHTASGYRCFKVTDGNGVDLPSQCVSPGYGNQVIEWTE